MFLSRWICVCLCVCENKFPKISRTLNESTVYSMSKMYCKINKRSLNIKRTNLFVNFPCGSAGKQSACNVGDLGSLPRLGRSPGEGKGYHSSILAWRIPWTM